jgi:hypothetical protein
MFTLGTTVQSKARTLPWMWRVVIEDVYSILTSRAFAQAEYFLKSKVRVKAFG